MCGAFPIDRKTAIKYPINVSEKRPPSLCFQVGAVTQRCQGWLLLITKWPRSVMPVTYTGPMTLKGLVSRNVDMNFWKLIDISHYLKMNDEGIEMVADRPL